MSIALRTRTRRGRITGADDAAVADDVSFPAAVRPRLFLLDPVCVLPFGHNVPSLNYYRRYLSARFDVVSPFVCRHLPEQVEDAAEFRRHFEFYYRDFIRIAAPETPLPEGPGHSSDRLLQCARRDVATLLAEHGVGGEDRVFVPSADYYLVRALIDELLLRAPVNRPRLFLRFIGVMEGASRSVAAPFEELLSGLRGAIAGGLPISLAAETPSYADLLSVRTGRPVATVPYPLIGEQMKLPADPVLRIYSAGSARFDKGYLDLLDIARAVACAPFAERVAFTIQMLPDADLRSVQTYTSQLYACPGVTLLPAILTGAEIQHEYRRSHAVIMPYDAGIYRMRGSAILMEAIAYGRSVLTGDGTAFAPQVRHYGNGAVCRSPAEYLAAIEALLAMPAAEAELRLAQARARFAIDTDAAYQNWIR